MLFLKFSVNFAVDLYTTFIEKICKYWFIDDKWPDITKWSNTIIYFGKGLEE